ncbi:MAG: PIN domain-containing protein [Desulfosalsimonadaceae bacterium]
MKYILDTNICIYWLKGNSQIETRAMLAGFNTISISFITLSELYYGAYKSQRVNENLDVIKTFEQKLIVIESDVLICAAFGKIKSFLENQGKIIDDADIFIAACALATEATLVTNNEKHFKRIKKLNIENWSK